MDNKHSVARYDPTVNLGHIIQTIILVAAVATSYTATQVQINSNSKDIQSLKDENHDFEQSFLRYKDQVREDLKEMRGEVQDVNHNVLKILSQMPEGKK
ncbi:hypothetical protein [Endozoicomonas ascidiicola]|uniref:hypothetical protein n=1 Tax=Endozoicomonas ascidiicola TaxID=1698521 RepID=UPI00082D7F26|nr:hypothetical protein [Endozoicomonas ascidiicola]